VPGPTGPTGATGATGPAGTNLWAAINATGTVARENGLATATKPGTGSYLLTWDVDVTNCIYLAVAGSTGNQATYSDGRIGFTESTPVTGQPTQTRVFTADKGGSQADRAFSVSVMC
jgi:hypothetical protein